MNSSKIQYKNSGIGLNKRNKRQERSKRGGEYRKIKEWDPKYLMQMVFQNKFQARL